MAQSAAQLANILPHRLTQETARAMRQKAEPALRILHAKRAAQRALNQTKGARLPLNGRKVARALAEVCARDQQRELQVRELSRQVEALSRPLSRADYRRAKLERYLGPGAVAPKAQANKPSMPEPAPTPIAQTNEPRMVEPLWPTAPGPKV